MNDTKSSGDCAYRPWRHRLAVALAVLTVPLLFSGGEVTTTGSGDAVPDYHFPFPISFGSWLPDMVGGVLFEHGHRLVAWTVGLVTLALAGWLALSERRARVRWLGVAALATVLVQGGLGGLRVKLVWPSGMAIVHACLAQLFFCLTIALASVTSRRWTEGRLPASPSAGPAWAAAAACAAQLALGAVVRHTGQLLHAHIGGAFVVALLVGWAAARSRSILLQALLFAQLSLGLATWIVTASGYRRDPAAPWASQVAITGHLVMGALLLAAAFGTALRASAAPREVPAPASREGAPA